MPDRQALVLLPGLLCDERLWRDVTDGLADVADITVADLTQDASVVDMAARVLAAAPERFVLGALSMGGYVAFEILRQQPQRVTRLALLDTSAAPDSPERAKQRRAGLRLLEQGRFLGVTQQLLPKLVHATHLRDGIGDEVRAMARRVGPEAYRRQQRAILERPDSRPLLPTIGVPTLVVVGEADVLTPPADAEVMQQAIPGAELVRIPECGHLPPMEAPEETTRRLRDWLSV